MAKRWRRWMLRTKEVDAGQRDNVQKESGVSKCVSEVEKLVKRREGRRLIWASGSRSHLTALYLDRLETAVFLDVSAFIEEIQGIAVNREVYCTACDVWAAMGFHLWGAGAGQQQLWTSSRLVSY
ncbi:hypothetical protein NX059_002139 [Plenodomus lindquistii]|nr:hypothetical protein NX059_002139 [Plenodomus lindquistii]